MRRSTDSDARYSRKFNSLAAFVDDLAKSPFSLMKRLIATAPGGPLANAARRGLLSISLALLCVASIPAPAVGSVASETDISVDERYQRATKLINYFLQRYHYRKTRLDNELSTAILDHYVERLDPNKSYFIEEDVRQFSALRHQFDDYLRNARLEPAYAVFSVYRNRVAQRVTHALAILDTGFDFDVDETYQFNREEAPWATTTDELDEIWRKRVKNDYLSLQLTGKADEEIKETLGNRYRQLLRRTEQFNEEDVFQFFINAYVSTIEPHTSYFSPRASENFRIRMSLSLEGIGAVLQTENEYTIVRRVVPGGPADIAGDLKAGDRIIGVGQGKNQPVVDVIGWRLDDVVDLIRGPKGSVVRLQILPEKNGTDGPYEVIALQRDTIKLEEQAARKAVFTIEEGNHLSRIGVIDVPAFYVDFDGRARGDDNYRSTTRDVRRLIDELKQENIDGLIVDLRGNGGGALSEATSLTGLFITSGPIVQVRDARGKTRINTDPDPDIAYDGPLMVMVDRNSASASEIFAGAIQDYGRGVIVGETTFGKGTVQNLIDLDRYAKDKSVPLGQLKVTIAQFFRVSGDSTQHRGVVPDIAFEFGIEDADHGERSFDNALPWTQTKAADFSAVGAEKFSDALREARIRHRERVVADPGFAYLDRIAELDREARELKTVSLLADARQSIRDEREKQREQAEGMLDREPDEAEDESQNATPVPIDPENDILLKETGRILADLIRELQMPDRTLVQRSSPADNGDTETGEGIQATTVTK